MMRHLVAEEALGGPAALVRIASATSADRDLLAGRRDDVDLAVVGHRRICWASSSRRFVSPDIVEPITDRPDEREVDVVVATGEQVSIGLVALCIQNEGGKAQSFLGDQCRITTDSTFSKARIKNIDAANIFKALKKKHIAVIAGFQGVDEEGNVTTLGRGGSDTTAVAIAAALKADACKNLHRRRSRSTNRACAPRRRKQITTKRYSSSRRSAARCCRSGVDSR